MAGNQANNEGLGDEFFEQILSGGGYTSSGPGGFMGGSGDGSSILLGLGPGDASGHGGVNVGYRGGMGLGLPLGLNLDHGSSSSGVVAGLGDAGNASSSTSGINESDSVHLTNLFPAFGQMQPQPLRPAPPSMQVHQTFQGQAAPPPAPAVSHPPTVRPRVRARRGQATDPHSIAERLRRERIAERMKALQELVPSCNKTDRAAMLDEIVDYVKFLRLQVKVLSMSRLGGAGAVAQLVADVPPSSIEVRKKQYMILTQSLAQHYFSLNSAQGEGVEVSQPAWEKWSNDGTEQQVAKLMEQDIGAAMQFLQSKALCIMPISLASAIFRSHPPPPDPPAMVKPESNPPP